MRGTRFISMLLMLIVAFIFLPPRNAKAMNNESAAMLAGAIALFGKPVLNAIAQEIFYPPVNYNGRSQGVVYYKRVYIYKEPCCYNCYVPTSTYYEKGWRDEMRRIQRERAFYEYERGRRDARRCYYYIDP